MDNKELDLVLDYLNEGIITGAIKNKIAEKKIKQWIKDAELCLKTNGDAVNGPLGTTFHYSGNISNLIDKYFVIVRKYGQTKAYKQNKNKIKNLYDKLHEMYSEQCRKSAIKNLLRFKKQWDEFKIEDTFEGDFLTDCAACGLKAQDIINHFRKSKNFKTYKYYVNLYYDEIENIDVETDPAFKKCELDDKCLEFYSNDDDTIIYNYDKNLLIHLWVDPDYEEISPNDLYKNAGIYPEELDETNIMKEEGIKLKI